jgi:hypothetical protein
MRHLEYIWHWQCLHGTLELGDGGMHAGGGLWHKTVAVALHVHMTGGMLW